jgi:O-antigen/teichoic acid export membrane protein
LAKELSAVLRDLLPKHKFARGASVLAGGVAGQQMMLLLAAPLLTRLYSPADFGLLAVYTGILSIFVVAAALRYEVAIPLPEDEGEAANLTVLSLAIVVLFALASAVLVVFLGKSVANLTGVPLLSQYSWLLPIGIFLAGVYQVFNFYGLRTKSFTAISGTRVKQALATLAIQLMGYKLSPSALLIGHMSGHGVGCLSLAKVALAGPHFRKVDLMGLRAAAIRYRRFPLYSTWGALLNTGGAQLPPLLLAALFSPAAAGMYSLAYRVLGMPITLIGNSIGNVFMSSAADARRNDRLAILVAGVYEKLAHIAMGPTLVTLVAGPELFAVVFGEQWRGAGNFARWMAPWLFLVFVTSPLTTVYEVLEKQNQSNIFQIALLTTRLGAIALGAACQSVHIAIALFSAGSALCWLTFLILITRTVGCRPLTIWAPLGVSLFFGLLCVSPLVLATAYLPTAIGLGFGLFVSLILVAAHLFLLLRNYWR